MGVMYGVTYIWGVTITSLTIFQFHAYTTINALTTASCCIPCVIEVDSTCNPRVEFTECARVSFYAITVCAELSRAGIINNILLNC